MFQVSSSPLRRVSGGKLRALPDKEKCTRTFAARNVQISEETMKTIIQATSTNSFLVSMSQTWTKRNGGKFDVTKGGFHWAEICELIGLFLLSQFEDVIPISSIGLYRDDGLAVSTATPEKYEKEKL